MEPHEPKPPTNDSARLTYRRALRIALALAALAIASQAASGAVVVGQMEPAAQVNVQPQYAVSLSNGNFMFEIINADATADSVLGWLAVQKNDPSFVVQYAFDMGSDVPTQVISPLNNGNSSDVLFISGTLAELQKYDYLFQVNSAGGQPANMYRFLENSTVYAGFGSLAGAPQTIEQAIGMTEGIVIKGNYPASGVDINDEWVLHYSQPPNLVPGVMERAAQLNDQPSHAVGLLNDDVTLKIGNADGTANATLHWIAVRKNDSSYVVNYAQDQGSDVPTEVIAPENFVNSAFLLVTGNLAELQSYNYAFNIDKENGQPGTVYTFLQNSTVYAGFGPLTGTPQTIEEAIVMTDGIVLYGDYPPNGINVTDEWTLHSIVAEPDPLPGDFDGDRDVDGADFLEWQRALGATGMTPGTGADGSRDGMVDAADLAIWRDHFGTAPGATITRGVANAAVPEPGANGMAFLAMGFLLLPCGVRPVPSVRLRRFTCTKTTG